MGKKNQKTKETDLRAKSASKEEDEDHNDDEGPGGGFYTVNVSDLETGQVHQVDRVRVTRDTGVWRLSIDTDGAAAKTQTTNWTSSPWNTSIGAAWRTGCRRGGPSLLSFCRPETALVPWPNSVPIPRRT